MAARPKLVAAESDTAGSAPAPNGLRAARPAAYSATRARSPSAYRSSTGNASSGRSVQTSAPSAASATGTSDASTWRSTSSRPAGPAPAAARIAAARCHTR